MIAPGLRLPLLQGFDTMHRLLGKPAIYAVPWQTPAGLSYDGDVDAWLDEDGNIVTKTPAQLTSYAIPALWGADAESLALTLGGVVASGPGVVAIAKAEYGPQLQGAMMVVTGSLSGEKYSLANVENAPDGGVAVFVVATLKRRERR